MEKDLAKMAEMIKEIDAETTEMKRKYRILHDFVQSLCLQHLQDLLSNGDNIDQGFNRAMQKISHEAKEILKKIGEA